MIPMRGACIHQTDLRHGDKYCVDGTTLTVILGNTHIIRAYEIT